MSDQPRIPPLPRDEWGELEPLLSAPMPDGSGTLGDNNIFSTFARHPAMMQTWGPFGGYLLNGTLPARDRELAILRTGANCGSSYEWGQHVRISESIGMDREEIMRVADGPEADGWDEADRAILRACDELHSDSRLSDETWAKLTESYDEKQMMELCFLIGHYHLVAFTLNSLGVQLDEGLEPLP
jgi:4-carboxymuconolactone decarboxylase